MTPAPSRPPPADQQAERPSDQKEEVKAKPCGSSGPLMEKGPGAEIEGEPKPVEDKPASKPKEDVERKKPRKMNEKKEKPKEPKEASCDGRKPGEIWWDDEMGRALFKNDSGVLRSSKPYVPADDASAVMVDFENGIKWRPPLMPSDLEKFGALPKVDAPSDPKPKGKARAKAASTKPVGDYVLEVIRCRYASQGKSSPIIKVEALVDRNNPKSKWHQVVQLVIKDCSANYAMNVCKSLADLFQNLNMNPSETNWRECRDSLLHYGASGNHDYNKEPLDWQIVPKLRLKAFAPSPKFLASAERFFPRVVM